LQQGARMPGIGTTSETYGSRCACYFRGMRLGFSLR